MRLAIATALLALSATQAKAQWTTNWFADFNTMVGPTVFTGLGSSTLSGPGLAVLGPRAGCTSGVYCTGSLGRTSTTGYDNHSVTLALNGLVAHSKVRVSFTALLFDSWDGTSGCGGACAPDFFRFASDAGTLVNHTFSNFVGVNQTYGPLASNAAFTGASEVGTLGPSGWFPGSSVYNFSFEFLHSGSTLNNAWDARGLQGWGDEGWSLDNIKIETFRAQADPGVVPEPGTYALLATGLVGLFGAVRRRRR